jgi:hypothetical protein
VGQFGGVKGEGGRCGERRGDGGEKEVVGEASEASEVVDCERDKNDTLVVESGDDLGSVGCLGAAAI